VTGGNDEHEATSPYSARFVVKKAYVDQTALIAEMQAIVRMAAEPRQPVDGIKAAVGRAAKALGISYRRAMTFWYGYTEKVLVTEAEAARLRRQRERLYEHRLERLRHDIACTERLLEDARRRNAEASAGGVAVGSDAAQSPVEVDGKPALSRGAAS